MPYRKSQDWNRKPPPGVQVNWSHPLANRLIFATICSYKTGGPVDLIGKQVGPAGVWSLQNSAMAIQRGLGYNFRSNSSFAHDTRLDGNNGVLSIAVFCRNIGGAGDNSSFPGLVANTTYVSESNNQGYGLSRRNSNEGYFYAFTLFNNNAQSSYQLNSTTPSFTAGDEHFVVGTCDGTTMRIYINGLQENSKAFSGLAINSGGFVIGSVTGGSNALDYGVYAAFIWYRCLSPGEVQQMYFNPYSIIYRPARRMMSQPVAGGGPETFGFYRRRVG